MPGIDDWVMAPLSEPEHRDFWVICGDCYQISSTVLTSQLPVSRWHERIGDPTLADVILDRLVHNAHRIEMRGDSMLGFDNKMKTITRQAYGFRNFENYRQRVQVLCA
jgi:DNA replication protein DnaC